MEPLRTIGRISLAIGFVLVVCGLTEALLREFAPLYLVDIPASLEYDKQLGYRLRPGVHLFRTTDHQEEVKSNRLGTSNFEDGFAGYKRLVFTIGDSTTEGIGVPADASYPFQLDIDLNTGVDGMYQRRYGVVNLGVGGYGALQELILLERSVPKIGRPAIILYMGTDNDYDDDLLLESGYRTLALVSGDPYWGACEPLLAWATDDLQLGLRLKLLVGVARRGQLFRASSEIDEQRSTAELEAPKLERLLTDASTYGSFLVVSWSDQTRSYHWLKSWAERKNVAFADWQPRAESLRQAMPSLSMQNQHSGGHYRTWVNRMIADEFARQIRQHSQ